MSLNGRVELRGIGHLWGFRFVVQAPPELAPTVHDLIEAAGWSCAGLELDGIALARTERLGPYLVHGATVDLTFADSAAADVFHVSAPVGLRIVAGSDAGRTLPLSDGRNVVGRQSSLGATQLHDRTVSGRHLQVDVDGGAASPVLVADLESHNGTRITAGLEGSSQWVGEVTIPHTEGLIHIGSTSLQIVPLAADELLSRAVPRDGRIEFVRPPRQPVTPALAIDPPPPDDPAPAAIRLDLIALAVPLTIAATMAVLVDPRFALLGLASPLMALGNYLSQRRRSGRDHRQQRRSSALRLRHFRQQLHDAQSAHRRWLADTVPSISELAEHIVTGGPLLWHRRSSDTSPLRLNLGIGDIHWYPIYSDRPARGRDGGLGPGVGLGVGLGTGGHAMAVIEAYARLHDAPVAIDVGIVGLRGDRDAVHSLARSLVLQAAALHGPADLQIVVALPIGDEASWRFVGWLPHTVHNAADDATYEEVGAAAASPTTLSPSAAAGAGGFEYSSATSAAGGAARHTLVVVGDAALVANRAMPVRQLLAAVPNASVLVLETTGARLPAFCRTVIDTDRDLQCTVAGPTEHRLAVKRRGPQRRYCRRSGGAAGPFRRPGARRRRAAPRSGFFGRSPIS